MKLNRIALSISITLCTVVANAAVKSPSLQSVTKGRYEMAETFLKEKLEGVPKTAGNQSSADITGVWNCDSFIVHRKPIEIQRCSNPDQFNSYKTADKLAKGTFIARYVGLNKTLSNLPNISGYTAPKGRFSNLGEGNKDGPLKQQGVHQNISSRSYITKDIKGNVVSPQNKEIYGSEGGYRIPSECAWTGNARVSDAEIKNMRDKNRNYASFWRKASTSTHHQVLPIDFSRPSAESGCYNACSDYINWLNNNGQIIPEWDEIMQCARGEGYYIKRYRAIFNDPAPNTYYRTGTQTFVPNLGRMVNNLYLDDADCKALSKYVQKNNNNGVDDINSCKAPNNDSITIYKYYNDIAWDDDVRERFNNLGANIKKTDTRQLLKASFNISAGATNLTQIKYLNPNNGQLKELYEHLFDENNVKDIQRIYIAFTDAGRDFAHAQSGQEINGIEIHNFYEQGMDNYNGSVGSSYSGNVNAIREHNTFGGNLAIGVGFMTRDRVEEGNFALKLAESLYEDSENQLEETYDSEFISGNVPQLEISRASCSRIGLRINTFTHFIDRNSRQTMICKNLAGTEDRQINLGDKEVYSELGNYLGFEYRSIDWGNVTNQLDITDIVVNKKQIPYIYYINDEDRVARNFNVHFIVSYKQDEGMKNIPRLSAN